jgi:hypothetical protein
VYLLSGLLLSIFNTETIFGYVATSAIAMAGLMLGVIAMQPGNPLDYRGFQRPG